MGWAALRAIFSQPHLVTLADPPNRCTRVIELVEMKEKKLAKTNFNEGLPDGIVSNRKYQFG
jgi:hypothetical protein